MEEEARATDVEQSSDVVHRTCIAFAESLKEWAELPVEGPDATVWAAALAHEMTVGFWRGSNVRVVSPENRLYRMMIEDRISAPVWRSRTPDLGERARQLGAVLHAHDEPPLDDEAVAAPLASADDLP